MSELVWLHEDALRADHPAIQAAGDTARVCFIWDEAYLQKMDYGFKRLVFIYETLCELPVSIYKGDTVASLTELVRETGADRIYLPETPNPELLDFVARLKRDFEIKIVSDTPFITISRQPDIKRFFRYWNKVKKLAIQKHGGQKN